MEAGRPGQHDPYPSTIQEMFPGAHHFRIIDSTFNYTNVAHGGDRDAGLMILSHHIATGASFDSAERYPPGRCHPGTRERVTKIIVDWIHNPTPSHDILWLYGPVGSGKSALAQSIAELLRRLHRERYGASFFFARDSPDRGRATRIFTTIAHQLAIQFPSVRAVINAALVHDSTLPTKSIEVQFQSLIIDPLVQCDKDGSWPTYTPTVIIDGLDECTGSNDQRKILTLVSQAIVDHRLPLRFLISSRPEYWIRDSFDTGTLLELTMPIGLRGDQDADNDIETYLRDGFEEIFSKNSRVMLLVKKPWPPTSVLERLVRNASGQFIFASTVLKFVGSDSSDYCDPREQLRIITTPGPHRASAFSDLDRLYKTILSVYPRPESLKRVLGGLLVNTSPKTIEVLLGVDAGELSLVLDALSSLLERPNLELSASDRLLEPVFGYTLTDSKLSFCRLSFREFLEDETRSQPFYTDRKLVCGEMVTTFFRIIEDRIEKNYPPELVTSHNPGVPIPEQFREYFHTLGYREQESLLGRMAQKIDWLIVGSQISDPGGLIRDMNLLLATLEHRNASDVMQWLLCCIREARRIGIKELLLRSRFMITPTLIFLTHSRQSVSVGTLSEIPGNTLAATVFALEQLRDIITMTYDQVGKKMMICIHGFDGHYNPYADWRDLEVSLAYQLLKSLVYRGGGVTESPKDLRKLSSRIFSLQSKACVRYLDNYELSDISSKDDLKNPHKMVLLDLLMDPKTWTMLWHALEDVKFEPLALTIAVSALNWFHRQLKTHNAYELLAIREPGLPQRIGNVHLPWIFEQCVRPSFTTGYVHDLWDSGYFLQSLRLEILLSNMGKFHSKFFCSQVGTETLGDRPIIDHSIWHPHLAAFLLDVVEHHCRLNSLPSIWSISKFIIPLLIESLPYAYPTQKNLATLRALRHRCPEERISYNWGLPTGFYCGIINLLKKYDSSTVSATELDHFEMWLTAPPCEKLRWVETVPEITDQQDPEILQRRNLTCPSLLTKLAQ